VIVSMQHTAKGETKIQNSLPLTPAPVDLGGARGADDGAASARADRVAKAACGAQPAPLG
jgi:hypothetical protein